MERAETIGTIHYLMDPPQIIRSVCKTHPEQRNELTTKRLVHRWQSPPVLGGGLPRDFLEGPVEMGE
jgi:hypothetical protein